MTYFHKKKGLGISWIATLLVFWATSTVAIPVGECPSSDPGYAIFLTDSVDCSVFYFCNWGEPVEFICPNGLLFNLERNSCDWPEDTDCNVATEEVPSCNGCSKAKCPAINDVYVTFFAHDTDCSKYCMCDWGVAYERPCPQGLHWNTKLDVCDWPHSAGCTLGENGGCNAATEDTPTDNSSTEDTSTDGNNNSTDIPPTTSEGCENVICPENNKGNVTFFPHENSCDRYCVCNWGNAMSMSCPLGLHFNTDLEVCDNVKDANCDISEGVTTEAPTESTDETVDVSTEVPTDAPTEAETDEPTEETTELSTETPVDLSTEAETEEPVTEVTTSSEVSTDQSSEAETDEPTEVPDEPTEVPDEPSTETEIPTELTSTNTPTELTSEWTTAESATDITTEELSTTEDFTTTESFLTTELAELPTDNITGFDGCSDIVCVDTTPTVLYPHKTVCDKYCICSFGILMEIPCIDGFHFNRALGICDYPSSAKCLEDDTSEAAENPTEPPVETDGCSYISCTEFNDTYLYAHKTDCDKYCICISGNTVEGSCSGDNLFNEDLKICDRPENVICNAIETTEAPEDGCSYATCSAANGSIFFAHKSDCKQYCLCVLGITIEFTCPEGYFFNDRLGICDTIENSDCIADNTDVTTVAPVMPPTNGCSHALCSRTDAPVFFAHETDCDKYCVCNFAFTVEMPCPDGLHFNTELDICDYPQNVNCNENLDQSTSAPPEGPINSESCANEVCLEDDSLFFYPHATDCSKYCICNLGVTIEMACPTGSYYSEDLNTCNSDENANCEENEDVTYPSIEFQGCLSVTCPEIDDYNVTFFPHDFDCERYCVCNWGYAIEMPCPDGLYFNTELDVCDIPENAGCYNQEVTSPEAENETSITEEGNSGEEEEDNETEPEDEVSTTENAEETSSEGEEDSSSTSTTEIDISTTEPTVSTTEPAVSTTEPAVSTTEPAVSTTEPAVPTTEPAVPIIGCDSALCPLVNDVYVTFLAHKLDCGKYCVCDWGRAIEMSCPSGLHFNINYNVCDYPSSAKCTI